jgi:acyl-CoA dehydrogenase
MFDVFFNDAQRVLLKEVRDFVKWVPRQLIIDMDNDKIKFPTEFIREAGRRKLLAVKTSQQYGGRGLKWVDMFIVQGEVTKLGVPLACVFGIPQLISDVLTDYGTEAQREKYLRPLIAGQKWAGEALTEPRGGSDFYGATTTAVKDGKYYILNGQKRFVVGSEGADFFIVYAVTNPGGGHNSLSTFIVDREMGVDVKHVYGLMGSRGTGTGRIVFRDVRVPEENLVGVENRGGEIFNHMMIPERMVGYINGSRSLLEIAAKYANKRKAFGQPIRNFEAVSFRIAECITKIDAVNALAYVAARTIDENSGSKGYQRRLVSELKKFATQTQWEVANETMQILGGIGYTNVFPIERAVRETRLLQIWTGTNDIQNLIIQHEFYRELLATVNDERNVEADIALDEKEAQDEKVYE